MFGKWGDLLEWSPVKKGLVAFGFVFSLSFGTLLISGAWVAMESAVVQQENFWNPSSSFYVGGSVGMIGAWIRLLLPRKTFANSRRLRYATTALLVSGIATIALQTFLSAPVTHLAFPDLITAFFTVILISVTVVGIFLTGATLGAAVEH